MLRTDDAPNVFIINAALTGMVPTRETAPHVPVTPEQVAADALAVRAAGAAIVHLHPRDADGSPTTDRDTYQRLVGAVRDSCPDLLISATCSGRLEPNVDARAIALTFTGALKPDLASLTCGSLNFPSQASVNAPDTIVELARRMKDAGVKPELEAFEPGMIHMACRLLDQGLLGEPLYVNLLLGNLGTSPATALDLGYMVNALPPGSIWSAAGIGRFQLSMTAAALALGGHVRVGLEDNPYYDWRERTHASNRQLVERLVRLGAELGRRPATPAEARAILQLPERNDG